MAGLLRRFVPTPQLQQVAEPWFARKGDHRGRAARRDSESFQRAFHKQDCKYEGRLRGSAQGDGVAGSYEQMKDFHGFCAGLWQNMSDVSDARRLAEGQRKGTK